VTSFKPTEQSVRTDWVRRLPSRDLPSGGDKKLQVVWKALGTGAGRSMNQNFAGSALKTIYLLITIMMLCGSHTHLLAQEVTTEATPSVQLPDAPGMEGYPDAIVLRQTDGTVPVEIDSDTQTKTGSRYTLDDDVFITYGDRTVQADHIEYDSDTGELTATGHLKLTGGANHEVILASHGTMNLNTQTGRFYDVSGSVGVKASPGKKTMYVSSNPFLFTGRVVVKTGPQEYQIFNGTLTSCLLPHPDWMLYAGKFSVDSEKASAKNSVFHLLNIPLLYLPYVTHPVDTEGRQSGILIPVISNSSTKGIVLGEEFYWAINRSMDVTIGVQYFSLRGWEQSASFRYRGLGNDFATARYTGLLDRGITIGGVYENQGGEDVTFAGRHDFTTHTRVAGNVEYLSSYAYREAFTENFNDAVSSDIDSILYGVHEADGYAMSARADRYQGLKQVAMPATETTPAIPEEEIRIFHVPSLDLNSTEHAMGRSGLLWSLDSSFAGLSRVQPNFSTGGITERLDLHPEVAYPLTFGNWHLRSSVGVRDTLYSRSRQTPYAPDGGAPVELPNALNRADLDLKVDLRAPVIERTFDSPGVEKLFGHDVKHTIEPMFTYRYVTGVNNFLNVLRFDDVDVASDTNELEYGVTQRLYLRPVEKGKPCSVKETSEDSGAGGDQGRDWNPNTASEKKSSECSSREWISWRLTQKYFFNENFGGAVVDGRRNIFDTTLNFSGIAFLTEPRAISPLVSRLRVRTSDHMDFEWDFDLDTGAKKFTSNNVLLDVHQGNIFGGLSYARLNAPGRFYTEGASSAVSDFSQLRLLLGYGSPIKPGFGIAANAGLDLNYKAAQSGLVQYGALQTSYNWNCCGLSVEYRKYELGSVRNESVERFNFTLVNIGTAGNLRRAASLF
jgi:LPS-assembly protein